MILIYISNEDNPVWWDAFRACADDAPGNLNALLGDAEGVLLPGSVAREAMQWARTLPGWGDGAPYDAPPLSQVKRGEPDLGRLEILEILLEDCGVKLVPRGQALHIKNVEGGVIGAFVLSPEGEVGWMKDGRPPTFDQAEVGRVIEALTLGSGLA